MHLLLAYKFLSLFFFLYIFTAESADPTAYFCNTNGSSQVSRNIDSLLPRLVSGTIQNGFITTSYGTKEDQIFGLAQCRGDVSKDDCSSCIKDAANTIRNRCPNQADSRIWYEYCFLRYSTAKFFGEVDTSGMYLYNVENVTDAGVFNQKLGVLTDEIVAEAVNKAANKGLGKGKSTISPFLTLYALVQCTRDLSSLNCAQCLAVAVGNFGQICADKKGCRVLYSSCYVRYELYPFFFPVDHAQESFVHSSEKYHRVTALVP